MKFNLYIFLVIILFSLIQIACTNNEESINSENKIKNEWSEDSLHLDDGTTTKIKLESVKNTFPDTIFKENKPNQKLHQIQSTPYEEISKYKHLLEAPTTIFVDDSTFYAGSEVGTFELPKHSIKVTGDFWYNVQPTGDGYSNSFHGSAKVGVNGDENNRSPTISGFKSIIEIMQNIKAIDCYYFFRNRVYVCSKTYWNDHENSPPDAIVFEYLDTLTNEQILIKGTGFTAGYVQ